MENVWKRHLSCQKFRIAEQFKKKILRGQVNYLPECWIPKEKHCWTQDIFESGEFPDTYLHWIVLLEGQDNFVIICWPAVALWAVIEIKCPECLQELWVQISAFLTKKMIVVIYFRQKKKKKKLLKIILPQAVEWRHFSIWILSHKTPEMEFYLLKQIIPKQRGPEMNKPPSSSVLCSFPEWGAPCDGADLISPARGTGRPFSTDPVISAISLRSRDHSPRKVHIVANKVLLLKNSNYSVAEHIKHNSLYYFLSI